MRTNRLTKREYEMADLIAWGCSADEVADSLHVSPNTVRNTLRNIYEKLGLNKANELAAYIFCTSYGVDADRDKVGNVRRAISGVAEKMKLAGVTAIMLLFAFHLTVTFDDTMRRTRRGRRSEGEYVETEYPEQVVMIEA